MPEASASVDIPHPPAVVWEYCTDPDRFAAFSPNVVEIRALTDGAPVVGSEWEGKNKLLGRTFDWRGEFTRVDVNKATEFRSTRAQFAFTTWTVLSETADGTHYTYRIESESGLGGLFGKMADPVVTRAFQKALTAGIDTLPDLIDDWVSTR